MNSLQIQDVRNLISDGMRIGIGGFWFVRTPTSLIEEVITSGARDLEVVCFGGGFGIERLIELDRVRTLYFSFHSLDVFGAAPSFRRAVEAGDLRVIEMTTLVLSKALTAAQENVPFLPILGPLGSEFLEGSYPLPAFDCPVTGRPLRAVPALPLDLALIHATRADREGNVEIAGARGLDRRLIGAALRSVVSVEEVAADFRGVIDAHRTTIPRFLVDHVIEVPRGAAPSSCLPFYETLYGEIIDELDPSIVEKGSKQSVEKPGTLPGTSSSSEVREVTPAERIAFLLARQLCADGVYTVGSVTPLSMVAYQLAKQTHAPNLTLIPFAGLVDVGAYPVGIPSAERNAMSSAHGFWGMDDLYEWLYQAGKIDAEIFCPAQIDERGHINNSMVRRSDGTFARLPGQAGIADVATLHQNLYMYVPRHSTRRLVRRVDFEGGSRELITNEERAAVGLRGGEVTVVTDLCVFRLDKVRRVLVVDSIHSGVTPEEVKASTGFPLGVDRDVPRSPEPSAEILTLIRKVIDPLRVRDLETVGAADRMPLIREIVSGDAARSATSDPC